MHVLGTHTHQQLRHADVGEAGHLEHVGEHPGLAEERVMRRRARPDDGESLEPLEEDLLRRRRQAAAATAHGDPSLRCEHAPYLRERAPRILETGKRLSEQRDVEHLVVKDEIVRVHDGVLRVLVRCGERSRGGDHVRRQIDRHVFERLARSVEAARHEPRAAADIEHPFVAAHLGKAGKPLRGTNVCAARPRVVAGGRLTIEVELQLPEGLRLDRHDAAPPWMGLALRRRRRISTICAQHRTRRRG